MKTSSRILSVLLVVALVATSPAALLAADKKPSRGASEKEAAKSASNVGVSTAVEKIVGPNGQEADLSISVIETPDEEKTIKEIVKNAEGPVVVFDNGENLKEVKEALEGLNLKEGQDVQIIEITAPSSRNWRQKFSDKMKKIGSEIKSQMGYWKENPKELRMAVVVNLAVTGIAGGVTYVVTHDLSTTVGTASIIFVASTLRNIFTDQWMKYLDLGGSALYRMSDKVSKLTDRVFNGSQSRIYKLKNKVFRSESNPIPVEPMLDTNSLIRAHERAIEVTGTIGAAAVAGAATYISALAVNGTLNVTSLAGAVAVGLLGAATAYDYVLFDVSGRYLLKNGIINLDTYRKIVRYSSFVSPSIDSVYIAAPQFAAARYVVVGLGFSGLILAYQGARVVRAMDQAKSRALSSISSYFSKQTVKCERALDRYDRAGFIPYQDVAGAPSGY